MQEIGEENKLIVKFMGYKYHAEKPDPFSSLMIRAFWRCEHVAHYMRTIYEHEEFKFHSSWDWLMPVLIKIESLGYRWEIGMAEDSPMHYCKIWSIGKVKGISPIDATWGAIIEFIKWYNTWKQKQ